MNRSASFVFACFVDFVFGVKANYAFKPTADRALRSNQLPRRGGLMRR